MPFTEERPPAENDPAAAAPPVRLINLAALVVLLLAASAYGFHWLNGKALNDAENSLDNLNLTQVQDLDIWRRAQLAAARTLARDPLLARAVLAAEQGDPRARDDLAAWAREQQAAYGWAEIQFFGADLRPLPGLSWLSTPSDHPQVPDSLLARVLASGQTQLSKVLRDATSDALAIAAVVPLAEPDSPRNRVVGLLTLAKDPRQALFPLLYKWSLQEIDAKSWLITTADEVPRLLAGPLGDPSPQAALWTDLSGRPELGATIFMRQLTDLAGRHAFAVTTAVPGSDWLVVTSAPVNKLLAPARQALAVFGILIMLIAATLLAVQHLLALRQRGQEYWRRYQGERERRQLAETLRERDSQLKIFFYHALTGIGVARADLRWLRINPALAELVGCSPEDLSGRHCSDLFDAQDRPKLQELCRELHSGILAQAQLDARLTRFDGALVPVRVALHAIRQSDESPRYLLVQIEDLRDRVEADRLYQVLIHTSIDGFWIIDNGGRLLEVNTGYCRMSGYARDELIGQHITKVETNEDQSQIQQRLARLHDVDHEFFETTHRHKNGSLITLDVSASYGGASSGHYYAFLRDITERKRIQHALEAERAQLHGLFDGIDAILYVADIDSYELLYANASFLGPLGGNALGQPCYRVMHGREQSCPFCTNAMLKTLDMHRTHLWQLYDQHADHWYRCADQRVRWSDGRIARLQTATDITTQKKADQHALQLEKLSSLGQLTAGLAHELNNPLMGIINAVQFCLDPVIDAAERTSVLRDAEEQTRRCIAIVRELLAFSRHQNTPAHVFRDIDPHPIIQRVLRLLKYRFDKDKIALELDLDPKLTCLRLQPERFEQVLINLLANAIDALAEQPDRRIRLSLHEQDDHVILEVRDNGPAVPAAVQDRVFEPLFTTKPPGKGTGFGLSTSWSIITDHGGTLEFISAEGQGARVIARWPRAPQGGHHPEQPISTASSQTHDQKDPDH